MDATKKTCPGINLDFTGSCCERFEHFIPTEYRHTSMDKNNMFQLRHYPVYYLILRRFSVVAHHKISFLIFFHTICHNVASWDRRDGFVVLELWHPINSSSLLLLESMTCFPLHLFCACASALPLHPLAQSSVTSVTLLELCVADRIVANVKAHFKAILQTIALQFDSIIWQFFWRDVPRNVLWIT